MDHGDESLAFGALGWILADERRAERFLELTGLTPDRLRSGLGERATLTAILQFLAAHEPDLLGCAEALGTPPEKLAAAARRLGGEQGASA